MNKYDFNNTNLLYIFRKYPDIISDRLKLYGLLKDYFPYQRLMIRVFMVSYDMGIAEEIEKNEITVFFFNRMISVITNEYGVKEDIAKAIVSLWCEVYAKGILNKKVSYFEHQSDMVKNDLTTDLYQNARQRISGSAQNRSGIDRSKHKNSDKYDKNTVVRNLELEEAFNITLMEYTLHENNGYLEIVGNIEVSNTSLEYLLCCSVYDKYNRLIRYQTCAPVETNSSRKEFDFEYSFDIPTNIFISNILLFPMLNPYVTE